MNHHNCEKCKIIINKKYIDLNFNPYNHYLFCKKCLKEIKVCSRTKSKKIFVLTDQELNKLKTIYLQNNTDHIFYLYDDVYEIVIEKYGSFENYKNQIQEKNKEKEIKLKKINDLKQNRENELKKELSLNKLEFKKYGDCYSYINYGKPCLKTVINNELHKNKIQNKRRIELALRLEKYDIPLDETLKGCYEYINGIDTDNIDDIVEQIKIEYMIKHNKDINQIFKIYNKDNHIKIKKYNIASK